MPKRGRDDLRTETGQQPRLLPGWACLLVGMVLAATGLLPWLITGLRLPLQNPWATETRPEQMPRVLLPFNQYAVVLIIAVLVTGAAAAGLCARALQQRLGRRGVWAVSGGVLLVQLAAVLQTATVVEGGLSERRASTLYLAGLVAVALLSVLVGVLALGLIAAAPPAGAVIGLSTGALAFGPWLAGLVVPFGCLVTFERTPQLLAVLRWAPPVLVGATVAWAGLGTIGRIAAAGVGLVLVWVVPALTTGLSNAVGSRVLARYPAEMTQYAVEVFAAALTTPALVLPPILTTVIVAAAGIAGHRTLRRQPRRVTTTNQATKPP